MCRATGYIVEPPRYLARLEVSDLVCLGRDGGGDEEGQCVRLDIWIP